MTPTARALSDLRKEGWTPWVVESRITPFVKRDLFNCIDILAIRDGQTLAVQVTAGSAHANRATKVRSNEHLPLMLGAGWIVQVWSYRKGANLRWVRRVEEME
jgi:predicted RecB family endonuclease